VKGRVERHSNPLLNQPVEVLPMVVCFLPDRLDFAGMLRFIG